MGAPCVNVSSGTKQPHWSNVLARTAGRGVKRLALMMVTCLRRSSRLFADCYSVAGRAVSLQVGLAQHQSFGKDEPLGHHQAFTEHEALREHQPFGKHETFGDHDALRE